MKPMTVKQVSELTGVSVRTLQYYDDIGLLSPSERTEAGYRLYEEEQLSTLQEILLFRELEFPLKEIKAILDSSAYDKEKALQQQVELLTLKKERLEGLIHLAEELRAGSTGQAESTGESRERTKRPTERSHTMDFKAFDKSKLEEYAKRAREQYSDTDAYKEYEAKSAGRTSEDEQVFAEEFMAIFAKFGALLKAGTDGNAASDNAADSSSKASAPEAQALVQELRDYITEHFYTCSDGVLLSLSKMYGGGGSMTESIDKVGGPGTGAFAEQAVAVHCKK